MKNTICINFEYFLSLKSFAIKPDYVYLNLLITNNDSTSQKRIEGKLKQSIESFSFEEDVIKNKLLNQTKTTPKDDEWW